MEKQPFFALVCQAVLRGLAALERNYPRSVTAEGQWPSASKKPGEGLLPGVHVSAEGFLLIFEHGKTYKKGTLIEKTQMSAKNKAIRSV